MKLVSDVLFAKESSLSAALGKGKEREPNTYFGKQLPRAWDVMQGTFNSDVLRGCENVVVIGIHGWFPGETLSPWEFRLSN